MVAAVYSVFAALCGWLEAILYARRAAESFSGNEHVGMIYQRLAAVLLVPAGVLAFHWLGWWAFGELLAATLLFPAGHDEAYNFTRLWIDMRQMVETTTRPETPGAQKDRMARDEAWYRYQYGYQSPTTTARNDFNGRQRTWLAAAGLLVLAVVYGHQWIF